VSSSEAGQRCGAVEMAFDGLVQFACKALGRKGASFLISSHSSLSLFQGFRMEFPRLTVHFLRLANRRERTSAQGMGMTAPESSSAARRAISRCHADSASSSTSWSMLSRRESARAVRASTGRAKAAFRISAALLFMKKLYQKVASLGAPPKGTEGARVGFAGCDDSTCRRWYDRLL